MKPSEKFDVAILGTGIGGNILGAILARNGLRVLLIEEGTHPRFAIGESTVPETTILFRVLAERFGVPELAHLSSYQLVHRHIGSTCGVKRSFSFVHHRRNEPQRPTDVTQYPTTAPPLGPDVHFYRQDIDAYLLSVALSYGAATRQAMRIKDAAFATDGVTLTSDAGEQIQTRFVVDAGGNKSMLAQKLGLRIEPCPLKTKTRSIYTHMAGVRPYDECYDSPSLHGMPTPFAQGTLHHIFDGGWMWVIPFDNHPMSTNKLVSVGINVDLDKYPPTNLSPEEEFRELIAPYPSLVKQFERASAVRPWTATGRLQFLSTQSVGDRFAILPHAFAFVDPLFSSGMTILAYALNLLCDRIIKAAADDDFSAARFQDVDHWVKQNFRYYDRLVAASYVTFSDFELWNAWMRVWMLGCLYGGYGALEMFHRVQQTDDVRSESIFERYPYRGAQAIELPQLQAVFDAAEREIDDVRNGTRSTAESAARIYEIVKTSGLWPPSWGPLAPDSRHPGVFTLRPFLQLSRWVRDEAPVGVREHYFASGSTWRILKHAAIDWFGEVKYSSKTLTTLTRDFLFGWNNDWKR